MFKESPLYYICISLIFLILFGAVAMSTWMVWLSGASFLIKLALTALGALFAALCVILYTLSAE